MQTITQHQLRAIAPGRLNVSWKEDTSNIKTLKQTDLPVNWVPWPMSSWHQVQSGGKEGAGPNIK